MLKAGFLRTRLICRVQEKRFLGSASSKEVVVAIKYRLHTILFRLLWGQKKEEEENVQINLVTMKGWFSASGSQWFRPVEEKYTPRRFVCVLFNKHLELLILQVWNGVGIVRQYNSEDENSIDIEFHDTSIHHAMHITNSNNYTLASLSTEAVLLASEGDSESGRFVFFNWSDVIKRFFMLNSAEHEI